MMCTDMPLLSYAPHYYTSHEQMSLRLEDRSHLNDTNIAIGDVPDPGGLMGT